MMAEAAGKLTGRPGICFVTRGPGATNASPGLHIARQDSTPTILFVGQIGRGAREREAFQELDYRAAFGPLAKWATEIDDPARIPEFVSRAFHVATGGRPARSLSRCRRTYSRRRRASPTRCPSSRSRPIPRSPRRPSCKSCSGRRRGRSRSSAAAAGRRRPSGASPASPSALPCRSCARGGG
jgi:thiamine pyrophosphate-dependent enzyme